MHEPTTMTQRRFHVSTLSQAARRPLWLMAALLALPLAAQAQVTVNQILFPVNIGRTLDATVTVDYTRTTAAPAVIQTIIPSQLGVNPPLPPANCSIVAVGADTAVECTVPPGGAGSSGTLTFDVRGMVLGAFSLVAVGTGGSTAGNTGTVRSSGDLTILKTKAPAGNLVPGQTTTFTLRPQLVAGADDILAGATVTVIDQLPGTVTDFALTAINAPGASCNTVANANSSRTVSCTYSGPLTVAALNAASITLTGAPGSTGTFNNVGSIAADGVFYFDRDPNNNIANVPYTVDNGGDVQALGSFPATPVAVGSAQTLTMTWRNNGPTALPAGGTVSTTIPAGFTVVSLPPGCSGPATGVVLAAPAVLTCTAAAGAAASQQPFAVPLLMPAAAANGSFVVTVAPPAGYGDAVAANNSVTLPWQALSPFADLGLAKTKSPATGAVAPNTPITTTLTVSNSAASPSPAVYSAQGGGTELRVVDYLHPQEISGDLLSNVSPGWSCSVSDNADPMDAARSKRVSCVSIAGGSLAPGASRSVSFTTTTTAITGQLPLPNRACTGETVLAELGLTDAQGPQPAGNGHAGNDCATAGADLILTDVTGGQGAVNVIKESSIDGLTWVDDPAAAPTLPAAADTQYWRITITTPSGGSQAAIPTLNLADMLPGILNVPSPGAPAPAYVTPAITVNTAVAAGAAGGSCPNVAAGNSALNCSFSNVAPGTTLVISYSVQRPFSASRLTNTATISSPNAILSGRLSDAAALIVEPRLDVAATTKTVTPATPRVGQTVQFTITAENLGPNGVAAVGAFKIIDDFNTSTAGAAVAFADIVPTATGMSCAVANSALADEPPLAANHVRVRCTNTGVVARYSTRTLTVSARVLKPASMPANGNAYTGQINSARVDVPDSLCEFKTETTSNPAVSAVCNDTASTSNNTVSVPFDVLVPQIDVQQRKTRVLPAGQTSFGIGQPLRYRFRLQSNGPSRAEGVTMTDRLTVPAGFTLGSPQVHNVNGVAAEAGYVLDTGKTGSVSCTQSAPNADLVCVLGATPAASYLDAGREVNFEVELQQTGTALSTVTFGNEALVCADESGNYEIAGACDRSAPNNNNLAAVNDVIFPRTDLAVAKSTLTPSPVGINQPVLYQLVVRNLGPSPTQRIRVSDVLPPDFEFIASGPQAPTVLLGSGVTAAPSTATGAGLTCVASPAAITVAGQQQTVSCQIDARPGPLGSGAFPGNANADNTLTLHLYARPKNGVYAGPYLADRNNSASVSPGLDGSGNPLSIDTVPGNNSSGSVVQVANSSLAGRVFVDLNGNGVQNGTAPAQDEGIGNVTVTLSGSDLYGNTLTRTLTTNNTVGATRGDYLFDHLPPGSYIVTETQPTNYANSPGTPPAATAGGTYNAAASVGTSVWTGITLPINTAASGYLFPETPPVGSGISGHVFSDRGDNGVRDASDAPLPAVTLGLYPAGTVCPATGALPGGALETVQTDAAGAYRFTSPVPGGNYVICQQQPAGYADRTPLPGNNGSTPRANQIDISNLPAGGSANNDFPEVLGRISGVVFFDHNPATPGSNNNGVSNAGEPGIGSAASGAGVPITLTGTPSAGPNAGQLITRTTTTAADGSFAFDELLPGVYTLTEGAIPPALGTYADGINTAGPVTGGTPGTAGAVGDNRIVNIQLTNAGAVSSDNRFAELPRPTISGLVFVDANQDRLLSGADPLRLAGVTVELRQGGSSCSTGTVLGRTTTDSNGSYAFPGGTVGAAQIVAGQTYRVCSGSASGYDDVVALPGTNGSFGGANEILITNLPVTGSPNNDFGKWVPLVSNTASIGGQVFIDRDRDGRLTAADPGRIAGVTVRLVDGASCSGPEIGRTLTDAQGRYGFPGGNVTQAQLVPGRSYSVCEDQPNGYGDSSTLPGAGNNSPAGNHILIPVMPAGPTLNNDFGELGARIAGSVYLDNDDDGQRAGSEPGIPGVLITLTGLDGQGSFTTRTDSNGNFAFEDLQPGRWTLTEQPAQPTVTVGGVPQATINGRTTAGTGGGTATPVTTLPSAIEVLTLPVGGAAVDNLFGERLTAGAGGAGPDLRVTKAALEARFVAGRTVHYTVRVRNSGTVATQGSYTVFDRLPAGLTLAAPPAGSGWTCTGTAGAASFSCSSSQPLAAGADAPVIELAVVVAANAASPAINAVLVEGGGEGPGAAPTAEERSLFNGNPDTLPPCVQPARHNACRVNTEVVQPAALSGTVWLETGSGPRVLDGNDQRLPGWIVELVDPATGRVVATATTGSDGRYRITDIEPGVPYEVRFRDPSSGVVYGGSVNGESGSPIAACNGSTLPSSCGAGRRDGSLTVILAPGEELVQQSQPVDPSGVVYDAMTRQPVAGAVVGFTPVGSCPGWDPASAIAGAQLGGYVINGSTISMTTGSNGFYSFVLLPGAPARCTFALTVTPPAAYSFVSTLIPPQAGTLAPGGAPGTAVAVQPQPHAPSGDPTTYYLQIQVGSGTPDIVNNHLPLDPAAPSSVMLRKTGDKAVAELGDSVRYRITVSIGAGASPRQVTVVDRLPAGFTFIAGTALVDGRRIDDPVGAPGPRLSFNLGGMAAGGSVTLQYRVRVGVGAQQGDGINTAIAYGCQTAAGCTLPGSSDPRSDARASNEDRYRVRVTGGAFSLEACVLGKVYVDCNGNHVQDAEELGIPGVRLVLQDGTFLTSDSEGKYSACGLPPRSHVLRIDESTLPRGSRLTTSSNRNLGDSGSLWLDLKNGEIQRADFIEGSCANPVLDQVKARRALGEVSAPQLEKRGRPALRFDSKAHGLNTLTAPTQGTDSANQQAPKTRPASSGGGAAGAETHTPTPELPMNRPPPEGRRSSDAPDAAASSSTDSAEGSRHGTR